jgi:hypothetical protein
VWAAHADIGGVGGAPFGLSDPEPGSFEQRLEQPRERAVLLPDVRFELGASPARGCVLGGAGEPGLDCLFRLARIEREDEVTQEEGAPGLRRPATCSNAIAFQKSGGWWSAFREYTRSTGSPRWS